MAKRGRPAHPDILTPREWEVLEHIQEGLSNEQIAGRLGISVPGVKFHVTEILSKLGLDNRVDAARWAASGAPRPWWLAAAAPFAFLGKLRPGWLSPVLASGLGIAVAAGAGVLIWALVATGGNGEQVAGELALPPGDKIAYIGTDRNIWILESDGEAHRITDGGCTAAPSWSPDGEWLAFLKPPCTPGPARAPERWLIRADGSETHVVGASNGYMTEIEVDWSPDSDRVLFASDDRLWLAAPEGSRSQLVTEGLLVQQGPVWSPDGETIAFGAFMKGVWLIDADGGEPRQIVSRQRIEQLLIGEGAAAPYRTGGQSTKFPRNVRSLRWSPDGEHLAFSVEPLPRTYPIGAEPDAKLLLTARRDGSSLAVHGYSTTGFDWAPDGNSLVLTDGGSGMDRYRETVFEEQRHIVTAVPGQGSLDVLTQPAERTDVWPRWSPDGARIAFEALDQPTRFPRWTDGPQEGIWVMDAAGLEVRHIAADEDFLERAPHWSADGSLLLYARRRSNDVDAPAQLWLARPDGSEPTELVAEFRIDMWSSPYGVAGFAWYHAPMP